MENVTVEITDQNDGRKAIITITEQEDSLKVNLTFEPAAEMKEESAFFQGLALGIVKLLTGE